MGQNNDPTERGELQGNQGGLLSRDAKEEERLRANDSKQPGKDDNGWPPQTRRAQKQRDAR